jgi:histidinol-phosphate aminotransferase
MGLETISGAPPFILVEVGDQAGEIREALVKQKIFVRYGAEWDYPKHLRVSYGLEEENQVFLEALRKLL